MRHPRFFSHSTRASTQDTFGHDRKRPADPVSRGVSAAMLSSRACPLVESRIRVPQRARATSSASRSTQPHVLLGARPAWRLSAKKKAGGGGGSKKDDVFDISGFLSDVQGLEDAVMQEEDKIVNVWNYDSESGVLVETQEVRRVRAKRAIVEFPPDDEDSDSDAADDDELFALEGEDLEEGDERKFDWVRTRVLGVDGRDLEDSIDYLATLSLDQLDAESRLVIEEELEAKRLVRTPRPAATARLKPIFLPAAARHRQLPPHPPTDSSPPSHTLACPSRPACAARISSLLLSRTASHFSPRPWANHPFPPPALFLLPPSSRRRSSRRRSTCKT